MMRKEYLLILALWFIDLTLAAQTVTLNGEYRINPVYSRGFREPMYEGDKAGFYTMQRTRLIFNYAKENDLETEIIVQDRRFWGDQDDRADVANLSVFRAWVEKYFSPQFSLRLGRQGFVYDDQHLLGDPDWVGTRAHDAGLLKYESERFKAHLGVAYNANGQELKREAYDYNMYKNMQFVWLKKEFGAHYITFTAINRGMEKGDTTSSFMQTFGPYLNLKISDKLSLKGMYYHQVGKTTNDKTVNASFYSAQLIYKPTNLLQFIAGVDAGSGTNQSDIEDPNYNDTKSFDRHYGLLHGHFGYMDYFYVMAPTLYGVHDYYIKAKVQVTNKFSIDTQLHNFVASASINDPTMEGKVMNSRLGIENDLLLNYKFSETFKATLGHSIMFETNTLDVAFGGQKSIDNQVFYAVITATPKFFKNKTE